ncbi:MAG: DNA translocase FtsK 4TM domain-containing protein, partial [Deltaproteobacteria bacterium]|nr:DNA translocase FtsK 4TM domain-containing protein [Deltaproteobacteria bacterium]
MAQSQDKSKPSFKNEFLAILGLFIATFLFLSIFSSQVSSSGNWCGEVGKLVAQILVGFTGWGAYLLIALLVVLSTLVFSSHLSFDRLPQVTLGTTGAVISCCGLFSSLYLRKPDLLEAGGFLGRTVFNLSHSLLGDTGTVLLLILILLISLMLATQFSPYQVVIMIWRVIKGLSRGIWKLLKKTQQRKQKQRIARKKQQIKTLSEPALSEPVPEPELNPAVPSSPPVVNELPGPSFNIEESEFSTARVARGDWKLPPLSILSSNVQVAEKIDREVYLKVSKQLEQKLKNFGVSGKVVGISP